ncbi:MFS transporter, partial [Mangrovactinospora gilvigrisea]|uniref:MFS transporter n=1 Tax=Mangrovactinospora gilvigrisea TaxID=1428644 RepID=UPI000A97D559
ALLLRTPLGPDAEERASRSTFRKDLAEGLRFVRGNGFLRYICVFAAGVNMLFGAMTFLFVVTLRQHGASPQVIGSCETVIAGLGLVGAITAERMVRRVGGYRLLIIVGWGSVPAAAALPLLAGTPYAAAALLGAIVLFFAPTNVALLSYLMQIVPDRLLARV